MVQSYSPGYANVPSLEGTLAQLESDPLEYQGNKQHKNFGIQRAENVQQ